MNSRERGFLLLTSQLGNPDRRPLTVPQLRMLAEIMQNAPRLSESEELKAEHLVQYGCSWDLSRRIISLLQEEDMLDYYLKKAEKFDCQAVTRAEGDYPLQLRKRLGLDSPGCLWLKGDRSLLSLPMVSLVGSRELHEKNADFAAEIGRQAARQGYVLVSGNARGADRIAQDACLEAGGQVVSIIADNLMHQPLRRNMLYISLNSYDEAFSTYRALQRNYTIHAMGWITFVAQCTLGKGGTWDGTVKNLSGNWSPVFCFNDGSEAAMELQCRGTQLLVQEQLHDFSLLTPCQKSFWI